MCGRKWGLAGSFASRRDPIVLLGFSSEFGIGSRDVQARQQPARLTGKKRAVRAAQSRCGLRKVGIVSKESIPADSFEIDRQQILDLISRYSYTWDGKDVSAFAALFQDNAALSHYSGGTLGKVTRSNEERLAMAREMFAAFTAKGIQSRHFQTNTILER
jgi:hypothetical protein